MVIHPTEMVMKYGDLMGYHGIKHWNVTGDIHRQDDSRTPKSGIPTMILPHSMLATSSFWC
jgi:hypothetical protein